MNKKILTCFLALCKIQVFVFCQMPITNTDHQKYWHYRQKLISDMLVIGCENSINCTLITDKTNRKFGGLGLSIPCNRYDVADNGTNHYNWGDATADLGWYIGILATELKLLYINSQNYNSTQYELYCALKAYERLDITCSAIAYPNTSTTRCGNINGTFIRDDVDANLINTYPAFSAKLEHWNSDLEYANVSNNSNSYMSQDQLASLFLGFALVKQSLENSPIQFYNGIDLVAYAKNFTSNIAIRMKNNSWIGRLDNGLGYQNCAGLYDEGNAYGFAHAASLITGDNSFKNAFCGTFCPDNWQVEQRWKLKPNLFPEMWSKGKDYSIALTLCYAAIGQTAWGDNVLESIKSKASYYDMDIYELIYIYLSNTTLATGWLGYEITNKLFSYIHDAPYQGPMNKPVTTFPIDNQNQVAGWKTSNRFSRSGQAQNGEYSGDYNGLDFMLLYNLIWLTNQFPSLIQTRYINGNILDTNHDIAKNGSVYRDGPIFFGSTIKPEPNSISTLVYMKSSFEINLINGFESKNNVDITLDVKPLGKIDGSEFRPVTTDDICSGFDFSWSMGSNMLCYLNCTSNWINSVSWTIQEIGNFSGNQITFRPNIGANYHILCKGIANGTQTQCSISKTINPIHF